MPLDDIDPFDRDLAVETEYAEDLPGFPTILACDDDDRVALTHVALGRDFQGVVGAQPASTSHLQHLRRKRDDLHVLLPAQLAGHRTKDAGADRLPLRVDQHAGIAVELDVRAVFPADSLCRSHDHGLADLSFFHGGLRDGFLDRHHNDITEAAVPTFCAPKHMKAHDF